MALVFKLSPLYRTKGENLKDILQDNFAKKDTFQNLATTIFMARYFDPELDFIRYFRVGYEKYLNERLQEEKEAYTKYKQDTYVGKKRKKRKKKKKYEQKELASNMQRQNEIKKELEDVKYLMKLLALSNKNIASNLQINNDNTKVETFVLDIKPNDSLLAKLVKLMEVNNFLKQEIIENINNEEGLVDETSTLPELYAIIKGKWGENVVKKHVEKIKSSLDLCLSYIENDIKLREVFERDLIARKNKQAISFADDKVLEMYLALELLELRIFLVMTGDFVDERNLDTEIFFLNKRIEEEKDYLSLFGKEHLIKAFTIENKRYYNIRNEYYKSKKEHKEK